jgi:hypothetical protein
MIMIICLPSQAGIYPFFYDGYHALEPFRREYHKKFGRAPFVHRYVKWQWYVYWIGSLHVLCVLRYML